MGAATLSVEVLRTLGSLGFVGLILALCFRRDARRVTEKALQNGQAVEVEIRLHKLKYSIGATAENKLDALPQNGGKLEIAVGPELEITGKSADEDKDSGEG